MDGGSKRLRKFVCTIELCINFCVSHSVPAFLELGLHIADKCEWYQSSHRILRIMKNKRISQIWSFSFNNKPAAQSLTANRTVTLMSCCAASSRAGGSGGGQSRTTVPLLTDLKLVFPTPRGGKIDASRSDKGQLLPASGQSEQNVSSVLTSTPSAVLVHVKTRLYFLSFRVFFCCKFTLYFNFLCLFTGVI